MSQPLLSEEIVRPDISHLVLEDGVPVDNFQSEKQQRLLVEPLYSSPVIPPPFIAAANVGIFYSINQDGIAPDVFLSLGVQMPDNWVERHNRSYLVWEFGKVPEVAIEVVSNRKGNELGSKKETYARMKVDYYVVFDPLRQLQQPDEMNGSLLKIWALSAGRYIELTPAEGLSVGEPIYLDTVNLGLTLWEGEFEMVPGIWLRWCDRAGIVIPTGAEARAIEQQRADQERQRAEQAQQQAEQAQQQAEQERQRAERLADRLRAMGIDPDDV
ncbi:Uma2 family endonuclease [Leptodesmis sichuanensis]|uniref:Uma2 family endonuclease n=1 Tax=Leptodesmis sichuanensis TaxID=2906798 RepID=UPI001F28BF70|nr:Uma2 family endonuclease [Leptodesmis sichuanensis]UIE36804.1 Uma2 family endonuclease [Leptodesmis sichuanensis A121]